MISRLTAAATAFAILATGSLALAANDRAVVTAAQPAAKAVVVVELPRVVVVGTRTPAAVR